MQSPIIKNNIDQVNSDEFKAMMEGDKQKNYYNEYCKLFVANIVLTQQLKEIVKEKNDLKNKYNQLENKKNPSNSQMKQEEEKTKRYRRQAVDIERHYKCPYPNCNKVYGAEGSLNQHMRLKHPEFSPESQQEQQQLSQSQQQQEENIYN